MKQYYISTKHRKACYKIKPVLFKREISKQCVVSNLSYYSKSLRNNRNLYFPNRIWGTTIGRYKDNFIYLAYTPSTKRIFLLTLVTNNYGKIETRKIGYHKFGTLLKVKIRYNDILKMASVEVITSKNGREIFSFDYYLNNKTLIGRELYPKFNDVLKEKVGGVVKLKKL